MPTYDYTEGVQAQDAKMLAYASVHSCHVLKRKFDLDVVIAWNSVLAAAETIAANDIFKVLPVPDDTFVFRTGQKIITAFASETDLDIGIAGADNRFQDSADITGTAGTHLITLIGDTSGSTAMSGYVITVADTIDATFNTAEADGTGSMLIYAIIFDVADDAGIE